MRIKKRELLEALDPKIANDLVKGKETIDAAKDFETYATDVVGPDVAKKLTKSIVEPNTKKELEEDKSPKKRVKEIVKVKNLKK
jgi:hypothetical protein